MQCRWIQVTDLGLTAFEDGEDLTVWATSLTDGSPSTLRATLNVSIWVVNASIGMVPVDTGSATSAVIPHGGTWPAFGSYYRIIVSVDADDDTNPANDTLVSAEITVPVNYVEGGENNNDGTFPFTSFGDYGITILPNQLVQITGLMDTAGLFDNFRWTAGAGTTRIQIKILWSTGWDDIDLYFWTSGGTEFLSEDTDIDEEPGGMRFTITGLTPGAQPAPVSSSPRVRPATPVLSGGP